MTSFEEFRKLCSKGNVIPVYDVLQADTDTPVSVFLKIKDESPFSFLLESVEGGEKLARYSFLGFDPFLIFEIRGHSFHIKTRHSDVQVLPTLVQSTDQPLEALKKIFDHFRTVQVSGLPRLTGGAIGYFGYEAVQLTEKIPIPERDELNIPDALLMFCDTVLIFDNVVHKLFLVSNAYLSKTSSEAEMAAEYEKAVVEINRLKKILHNVVSNPAKSHVSGESFQFSVTREEYCLAVQRIKQYISEGDIFQSVLSQRVKKYSDVSTFDLYRTLRQVNPSPYMYYLNMEEFAIIGSSPEMLVRVENQNVETRPIAGTRRRGRSQEEDERLEQEMMNDAKERAEHLMLVDLARNDIGRISDFGSVSVTQFMTVEKYSHVMHIVSAVEGRLRKGLSPLDALFSCFPAGTLTGAPKIRAMEIIAELEGIKRNVYGGAVGYLDFSGNLDSCIAIRTIIAKDGCLYLQAGAGIVNDSNPDREYEETMEKLGANLNAIDIVSRA